MHLSNTFTVDLPVDEAWRVCLDLERVAPCLPGATITAVDGEDYQGRVAIKVGPITAKYEGVATFLETDEAAHRAVISAKGKDVAGSGGAEATIVATLSAQGGGTQILLETELDLSGRMATFGRGIISDVSGRILRQFATNLQAEIARPELTGHRVTSPAAGEKSGHKGPATDEDATLDVLGDIVPMYAVRAVAGILLLGVGALVLRRATRGTAGSARAVPPPTGTVNIFLGVPESLMWSRVAEPTTSEVGV